MRVCNVGATKVHSKSVSTFIQINCVRKTTDGRPNRCITCNKVCLIVPLFACLLPCLFAVVVWIEVPGLCPHELGSLDPGPSVVAPSCDNHCRVCMLVCVFGCLFVRLTFC